MTPSDSWATRCRKRCGVRREHPGAVAGVGFTATGTPMIHAPQNRGRVLHDLVAAHTFNMSDKADAAVFVLKLRIVEPRCFRCTVRRTVGSRILIAADVFHRNNPGCGNRRPPGRPGELRIDFATETR
ncbi:MAG UNVERIFIED_CONTAM: hypothetical protein LVR18_12320 [Planctomycetaceae bacterium]